MLSHKKMAAFDRDLLKNTNFGWKKARHSSCGDMRLINSKYGNFVVKSCIVSQPPDIRQTRFEIERHVLKKIQSIREKYPDLPGLNHIVEFSGEFTDADKTFFFIPYYEGFMLSEIIKDLSYSDLLNITRQVFEGINVLEQFKINHRDLHYGNIIIGENNAVRIIDFDLSYYEGSPYSLEDLDTNFTGEYLVDEFVMGLDIYLLITNIKDNEKYIQEMSRIQQGTYIKDLPLSIFAKRLREFWDILNRKYGQVSAKIALDEFSLLKES